jgi:hypothetical protein
MKKIITYLVVLLISLPLYSKSPSSQQDSSHQEFQMETLLAGKGEKIDHGGFISAEAKYTQIKSKENGLALGGRVGWIINHTFSIGLGGYGLVSSHELRNFDPTHPTDTFYIRTGWGGLNFQYTFLPKSLVHFTANALIGAGGAYPTRSLNHMINHSDSLNFDYNGSAFFVLEPGIGVEMNVTKYFRVELMANYRYITGLELKPLENKDLGGFSANLALKFGKF